MSKSKKPKSVGFGVKEIKLVHFSNNIPESFDPPKDKSFEFGLQILGGYDIDQSIIGFKVDYGFYDQQTELIKLVVENSFKVGNVSDFVDDGKLIKSPFLDFLAEVAINQTRGMQAYLMKDVPKNYLIPVISPKELKTTS